MKKAADPILIEVLRNEMGAIAEEMAIAVYKTARSSMLRVGDFATSLADYRGRIVGLGQSHSMATSVFMHLMPFGTETFKGDLKPGDVILANDPYSGASHMPDVILIMPVFHRAQVSGFVIIYSHQTDIGGRFAGGFSSQCTETYEEGIRLPNLKLYDGGVRNEALVQLLKANIRAADEWMGDIDAKLSGSRRGIREFEAVMEKYGMDDVNACFDYLVDYAEQAARKAIAAVPPGDYTREIMMRDDGFGSEGVAMPIRLTLRFRPDKLIVDFTGTAPQARGAINMPYSNTLGQVYSTIHRILAPDVVFNAGFVKPFEIVAPEGTLANPKFPGAVGGRAPLFFLITEVIHLALAEAIPDRVAVPQEGGDIVHMSGHRPDGSEYTTMDLIWGGWGGRPRKDGIDGAGMSYISVPAELVEREVPVVVEGFGLVPDTAGSGRHRGSLGIFKSYRFRHPAKIMVRTNRPFESAVGMAGGRQGRPSCNLFTPLDGEQTELPRKSHQHLEVKAGDRIYHQVCGSGGHGDPYLRDPAAVLEDVREEKLSLETARAEYGVAIDPINMTVDAAATHALRAHIQ
ncbi:MAG TPA: hydantoinase B/oxoprolinase family protein [Candidatus Binataceae bacterium]|nr:hydantoinase B/oxoprolinase family protein [Candidatus Binataceae bacterium]